MAQACGGENRVVAIDYVGFVNNVCSAISGITTTAITKRMTVVV